MGNICCPFLTEYSAPEEVNLLPIQEPKTFEDSLTRKDTHLLIRIVKNGTSSATINATKIEIVLNPNEDISFEAVFGRFLEENVRKSYFKKLSLSVQNSLYDERVVSLFDNFIAYLSAFHVKCVEFAFFLRKDQQLENFIQFFEPVILSPKNDMDIQLVFGLVATQFSLLNHIRLNDLRAGSRMMEHFKIIEIKLCKSLRAKSIDAIKEKWDLLSDSEKSQKVEVKAGYHFFQYDISVRHFEAKSKLTVTKSQGEKENLLSVNVFKFVGSANFPFNIGVLYLERDPLHSIHSVVFILMKAKSREMLEEQFKRISFGDKILFEEGCKEFIFKVNSPN